MERVVGLGEQRRALVGHRRCSRWLDSGGLVGRLRLSPSNQAAHRESRWPLRRISYHPAPLWVPVDVSLMALLRWCIRLISAGFADVSVA